MSSGIAGSQLIASNSLYVGELNEHVNEARLYAIFNTIGPVASIKVCRHAHTQNSLKYAYVNYHSVADAEKALLALNYTKIDDKPCRIMWSQRDPTLREDTSGNVFVRNLDKSIDNKTLHSAFIHYGNILSCKIAQDMNGKSLGYGYVHFESAAAAERAIKSLDGIKIGDKIVNVCPFLHRAERESGKLINFTNVYAKNLLPNWTEDDIRKIFEKYGKITSIFLSRDSLDRPYACINYEQTADAKRAIEELNNATFNSLCERIDEEEADTNGSNNKAVDVNNTTATDNEPENEHKSINLTKLYVARAVDRHERIASAKAKPKKLQASNKTAGCNLYVKNLVETIDDENLNDMFSIFGEISSAKVMKDENGVSKGFGFVCFVNSNDALEAISKMHLKQIGKKPLYVGIAEQKERRQARLVNQQRQNKNPNSYQYTSHNKQKRSNNQLYNNYQNDWNKQPLVQNSQQSKYMWHSQAVPANYPDDQFEKASSKQLLGEQLFQLVHKYQPSLAGKITGMMLDMDEDKLKQLMKSEDQLMHRIDQAMAALQEAKIKHEI